MGSARIAKSLPLQVAAVCYRRRGTAIEFLLVNTNGGTKWTFPKGSTDPRLSHSQAAEREAAEEAGALGTIEPRHFHLYIHSKGVFWQSGGVLPEWSSRVRHHRRRSFLGLLAEAGFNVASVRGFGPRGCPKWHLAVAVKR